MIGEVAFLKFICSLSFYDLVSCIIALSRFMQHSRGAPLLLRDLDLSDFSYERDDFFGGFYDRCDAIVPSSSVCTL